MSNMSDLLYDPMHQLAQIAIEDRYSRSYCDQNISEFIKSDPTMLEKHAQGVELVYEYMSGEYYPGKMNRIHQLKGLDIDDLVSSIFIGVAHCVQPVLFTSITAQMAGRLRFSDKTEAISTIAEILAVLCQTDIFDISKADRTSSLVLVSRIPLSDKVLLLIEECQYLPPMVCVPDTLTSNSSGGYLTHNDSLMLGTGNHHLGNLCLDTLNLMNSTALQLDVEFLANVPEEPTFLLDTQDKAEQWGKFKTQSASFYDLMIKHGNKFYLTHKVDKRGRIYAQGYHISTQSNAYKKASIELAHKELVTGVP